MPNAITVPKWGRVVLGLLQLHIGWVFGFAFMDKLLGLGWTTCAGEGLLCDAAWVSGGSPTFGFLNFGTAGPFADMFSSMAGNTVVDFLFMAALFAIAFGALTGIGFRVAMWGASALLILMYLAAVPWAVEGSHNFLTDSHTAEALPALVLAAVGSRWEWGRNLVANVPVLGRIP